MSSGLDISSMCNLYTCLIFLMVVALSHTVVGKAPDNTNENCWDKCKNFADQISHMHGSKDPNMDSKTIIGLNFFCSAYTRYDDCLKKRCGSTNTFPAIYLDTTPLDTYHKLFYSTIESICRGGNYSIVKMRKCWDERNIDRIVDKYCYKSPDLTNATQWLNDTDKASDSGTYLCKEFTKLVFCKYPLISKQCGPGVGKMSVKCDRNLVESYHTILGTKNPGLNTSKECRFFYNYAEQLLVTDYTGETCNAATQEPDNGSGKVFINALEIIGSVFLVAFIIFFVS